MIYVFFVLAAVAAREVTTLHIPLETRKNTLKDGENVRRKVDQLGLSFAAKATQHTADLWRLVIAAEHGIAGHTVVSTSIIVNEGLDVLIDMTADIPGVQSVVKAAITSTQNAVKDIEINALKALGEAKERADVILHKSNSAVQRVLESLANRINNIFGGGR